MNEFHKKWIHINKLLTCCDEPFLDFLDEHWDDIKNPENLVDLLVANENQLIEDPQFDGNCGEHFIWEYDVAVEPFNYRCFYTISDIPKKTVHTTLGSLQYHSYETWWRSIKRRAYDIQTTLKMTGTWDSELKIKDL